MNDRVARIIVEIDRIDFSMAIDTNLDDASVKRLMKQFFEGFDKLPILLMPEPDGDPKDNDYTIRIILTPVTDDKFDLKVLTNCRDVELLQGIFFELANTYQSDPNPPTSQS
jgi:hypothetical protein